MTRELNILPVISIPSLTSLITKYPTIGARKAKQKKDLNYHAWTSSTFGGHQVDPRLVIKYPLIGARKQDIRKT